MGMPKYDRLLYILNVLRARKNVTASRLASECGVTERSIYRDIVALSEANVPVYYDNGYKIASDNFLPPLNFTFDEYTCLKLALESSPLRRTVRHNDTVKRIRAKVEAGLSRQVREMRKTAVETTHIDISMPGGERHGEKFFRRIEDAIANDQCLQIEYKSIGSGLTIREVEPYFIIFRRRAFYFVAYCRLRKDFRTFRIDRIQDVQPIESRFRRRKGIRARDYFEGSWEIFKGEPVEVEVRFRGAGARVVCASEHHRGEIVEVVSSDEILYRVTVNGLEEIQRWILGFGADAVVSAPKELRASLHRIGQHMREAYRRSK